MFNFLRKWMEPNRPRRSAGGGRPSLVRFTPRAEALEPRRVLSAVAMTDQEQLLLELVNRARLDPAAEVARYGEISDLNSGLPVGTISAVPKQPLAPSQALVDAASGHVEDMLSEDYFAHTNLTGQTPTDRAAAAGYSAGVGENISWAATTDPSSPDVTAEVYGRHRALFLSPQHRQNMLLGFYREAGTGVRRGVFTTSPPTTSVTTDWDAIMVAESFGSRSGDHFITGVAYADDVVADNFYTPGESTPDVRITAVNVLTGTTFFTQTGPSGGYALAVPDGTYTVTATGGPLPGTLVVTDVEVTASNVKVDFETSEVLPAKVGPAGRAEDGSWWVAQSDGTSLVTQYFGKWSASVTWQDVLPLDFNGDGLTDVAGRTGGGWWIALSTGKAYFVTKHVGRWSTLTPWFDVSVGDFNGDGLDDIAGRARDGTWWVARSDGNRFRTGFWGRWSPVEWHDVRAGDVNGDGRDDLVGRAPDGTWWVAESRSFFFRTQFWGAWSASSVWTDVQLADLDGNGRLDIAGRNDQGQWWVARSTGNRFDIQYWGQWSTTVTWEDVRVGDWDGDGDDDIAGRAGGQWWVARSDQSRFLIQYWGSWSTRAEWQDVLAGDVDGDGDDDLLGRAAGQWWLAESTGGQFVNRYLRTAWSRATAWRDVAAGNFR
jgi:hypothetical protein